MIDPDQRRIGNAWGDFPWSDPPRKLGPLLSGGVVARNMAKVLRSIGTVVPYTQEEASSESATRQFLQSLDLLWADLYEGTQRFLEVRADYQLPFRTLLFAAGAMPKGAEGLLREWRDLLRPSDVLVFTSRADQEIWRALTSESVIGQCVLPIPVDDEVFTSARRGNRDRVRDELGISHDVPVLLYVGRINIQKNVHLLLRTLSLVRERIHDAELWIVGEEDGIMLGEFNVPNTGYKDWLTDLARELEVAPAIRFLGLRYSSALADIYGSADVLVNLSVYHRENFGIAQAEAQACGLPVVCTAWGGFKDVVAHGKTGFLVDAVMTQHGIRVDWQTAAHHVLEILRDSQRQATLSREAAQWAKLQFSIDSVAQQLSKAIAGASMAGDERAMPYRLSDFAEIYERHKRESGWYDHSMGYTGMFQGHNYAIYEKLIGPYATRHATDLHDVDLLSVPYLVSAVLTVEARRQVHSDDPIWPVTAYLDKQEWLVLSLVDGLRNASAVLGELNKKSPRIGMEEGINLLKILHLRGLVMFCQVYAG